MLSLLNRSRSGVHVPSSLKAKLGGNLKKLHGVKQTARPIKSGKLILALARKFKNVKTAHKNSTKVLD